MNLNDKIYIAGHRGLVGSAIVRQLELRGFTNLLMRTHKELDLTNQAQVQNFFQKEQPDYVILAAAKWVVFMLITLIRLTLSIKT